jgi:integrase
MATGCCAARPHTTLGDFSSLGQRTRYLTLSVRRSAYGAIPDAAALVELPSGGSPAPAHAEGRPEGADDRVALRLLFLMGLRTSELASTRYRDFDLGRRRLRVHGKGGKIRHTPIPTEELAELSLRRDPQEHLLYPQKRGPKGTVIWENRLKGLSGRAMHRWWYRCLARAGVVDQGTTRGKKMHGARYTSGTELYLATGDIYATKQLLGHADRQHHGEHPRPGAHRPTSRRSSARPGASELRTTVPIDAF